MCVSVCLFLSPPLSLSVFIKFYWQQKGTLARRSLQNQTQQTKEKRFTLLLQLQYFVYRLDHRFEFGLQTTVHQHSVPMTERNPGGDRRLRSEVGLLSLFLPLSAVFLRLVMIRTFEVAQEKYRDTPSCFSHTYYSR